MAERHCRLLQVIDRYFLRAIECYRLSYGTVPVAVEWQSVASAAGPAGALSRCPGRLARIVERVITAQPVEKPLNIDDPALFAPVLGPLEAYFGARNGNFRRRQRVFQQAGPLPHDTHPGEVESDARRARVTAVIDAHAG